MGIAIYSAGRYGDAPILRKHESERYVSIKQDRRGVKGGSQAFFHPGVEAIDFLLELVGQFQGTGYPDIMMDILKG